MEQASSLDYLNDLYDGATDRIHIRFLCNSMIAEEHLMKSLQRSWTSICKLFPDNNLNIDISNHPILNIYPYETKNQVEVFQNWAPPVYFEDNFVCGSPTCGFKKELNDPIIKKIYTEQFYFRLSVLCYGRERLSESKAIIHNLLQNADVPSTMISSIEIDSSPELDLFDIKGLVPELVGSFTSEPFINTPKSDPTYVPLKHSGLSREPVPFNFWSRQGDCSFVSPVVIDAGVVKKACASDFKECAVFYLSTEINWHKSGNDVFLLSESYQGKDFPVWEVVRDELGGLALTRKVSLPISKTVDDALLVANKYPTNSLFQEVFPLNYVLSFKFSDVPYIPSLLASGVAFTGASLNNNIEGFSVFVDDIDENTQNENEYDFEPAILEGTEPVLSEFLNELIDVSEKQGVVSLDDMRFISKTLNAEPADENIVSILN